MPFATVASKQAFACRARGKKTKGRKRLIVTDTGGNLLGLTTHAADIQDRDGAPSVIAHAIESHPTLANVFTDGGYAGDKLQDAMTEADGPTIEIVKRPPGITGFVVIVTFPRETGPLRTGIFHL